MLSQVVVEVVAAEVACGLLVAGHVASQVGQHVVARGIMPDGQLGQEVEQEPELGAGVGLNPRHLVADAALVLQP